MMPCADGKEKWQSFVHLAAAGEGAGESEFVSGFEAAAGWEPLGDARDDDGFLAEEAREIICGGLAFDVRPESEDDLAGEFGVDTREELLDAQLLGAYVVEGGEPAAEGVVAATVNAGALERENVGGLLDDAEQLRVSGWVGADLTDGASGEKGASLAGLYAVSGRFDGLCDFDGTCVA